MALCRLGDIEFNVVSDERPQLQNEITDRPVEDLGSVVDHINNRPLIFSIEGYVTDNAFEKLQRLNEYVQNKEILTYVGRNQISRVAIESLSRQHNNSVSNGFSFSMTLKQIRVATFETVQIIAPDPAIPRIATATQTKDVSNKGIQTTQSRTVDIEALRAEVEKRTLPPAPPSRLSSVLDAQFPYRTSVRGGGMA